MLTAIAKHQLLPQVIYYPGRLINHSLNLHMIIFQPPVFTRWQTTHFRPFPHVLHNANYYMPKVPSVDAIPFSVLESTAFLG